MIDTVDNFQWLQDSFKAATGETLWPYEPHVVQAVVLQHHIEQIRLELGLPPANSNALKINRIKDTTNND
jgi:hypothetical protein